MEFKKYNSIENSYRTRFINKVTEEGHANKVFVVQEKIHGANFSFWSDENKTVCGKRSGIMGENENFFGFQAILKKYHPNLRALFLFLQEDRDVKEVAIFGELYGGMYPHVDVERSINAAKVQSGVFYRPDVDFIAFDLVIDGVVADVYEANAAFEQFEIPFAQTLFMGTLQDCLKYPNEYAPTIPTKLGLPEIKDNVCEGNVIRPLETTNLWSGERLILKNKNSRFSELDSVNAEKFKDTPKPLSPEAQAVVDKMSMFINENRLRNVLSKIGEVTQKDFGKILGLFNKDVWEDFLKDDKDMVESLDKDAKKQVDRRMGQTSALLLRGNFQNILDGTF